MTSKHKNLGIVLAVFFISILVLAAFYWHSNHQTTDIDDDMKSNNTTDERVGDTNKINDTKSKTIKSIELEKPPFID